jgi:hypothetical protein
MNSQLVGVNEERVSLMFRGKSGHTCIHVFKTRISGVVRSIIVNSRFGLNCTNKRFIIESCSWPDEVLLKSRYTGTRLSAVLKMQSKYCDNAEVHALQGYCL